MVKGRVSVEGKGRKKDKGYRKVNGKRGRKRGKGKGKGKGREEKGR